MSRKVKILGWLSTVLVLLVLVVVVAAKLLVTPEGVRQALLPLAEEKLGRPVEIGEINIKLFSGITLEKITVPSGQNGLPLFQAEKVLLRYRFWPLLTGRVMIDQISLQKPVLRLHRDAEGHWNLLEMFDQDPDLSGGVVAAPDDRSGGKSVETSESDPVGGFNLLVTNIVLAGGELEITDRKLNPAAPYRFQLKDIELQVKELSLEQPFPLTASVHVGPAPISLVGSFDPTGQHHDLQLQTKDFDLAPLSPYLKGSLPGIFSRARLTTDIRFAGNSERFDLQGPFTLNQIYLVLDALENTPIRNASLTLEPDLTVDRRTGLVSLRPSTVSVDGVSLQLTGSVEKIEDQPAVDVQVAWQDIGLRELLAVVPQGLLPRLDQVDPAGRLSGHVDLRGPLSQPEKLLQAGKLSLADVQVNLQSARPALSGDLNLVGTGLASEKLSLRFGDDHADLNLTVKDLLTKPVEIKSHIQAQKIDIDRLLKAVGTELTSEQRDRTEKLSASPRPDGLIPNEGSVDVDTEPGPFDLPLAVDGTVDVQELLVKGLTVGDFKMAYRLANNLLDVRRMTGTVAGGRFSKTARINLAQKGFSYESTVKLEDVNSDEIINAMLPDMQGSLTGKLNLDAGLKGKGTTAVTLEKYLSGKGSLNLVEGVANGTKISRGLVNLLGMKQLEQITIQKADGTFSVGKGVVNISGIVAGRDLQMVPEGKIYLAGKIDLGLMTRLAPAAAAKLGSSKFFTRLLKDDDGWTMLPLKLKGSIDHPKVSLDEKQLGRQAEKKLKRKLEQKLLEKFAPEPKEGEAEDPSQKILKDTLRGLFGK